jgi:flap endonuclease-1
MGIKKSKVLKMGITGLKKLLRKESPDAFKPFYFDLLQGKKVAIDSSILLYKFRYTFSTDDFHIRGFKQKVEEFKRIGIHPVFVFDGKPPEAKREILNQRKENRDKMKDRLEILTKEFEELGVSPNFNEFINDYGESDNPGGEPGGEPGELKASKIHAEMQKIKKNLLYVHKHHSVEVMDLLKSLGIPFFESYGEAEEFCAFLQKKGVVEYILTEDTDILAFGGTNIIFQTKNKFEIIVLETILNSLEINYFEFIDLCILCGCDYTQKIPKVGPVSALRIIKEYRTIENFIENQKKLVIPDSFNYHLARSLFLQNNSYELN